MFSETIKRYLKGEKYRILRELRRKGRYGVAIQLYEEPGEVMITRLMDETQVFNGVCEAVSRIFKYGDISVEIACSRADFVFVVLKMN